MKARLIRIFLAAGLALVVAAALASRASVEPQRFLPGDDEVGLALGDQTAVAIAKGVDTTLVVWSDARALAPVAYYEGETSKDIYGVRVASDGEVLDAVPIAITTARANQESPRVAWNGTNWLVVFESYMLGGTGYYYEKSLAAVRVSPSGEVLDPEPIPIYGVKPSPLLWAIASDGDGWVVAFEGCSASYDIMALRISAEGVVLDPPTRSFVPATYYTRGNLHLAYAGGVFLLTYDDAYVGGTFDTKAVRFDRNLTPLDVSPISFLQVPLQALAGNGSEFYAVWHQQQPNYTMAVTGSRVSTAGVKLDGTGKNISANNQPQAFTTTSVVWDGTQWKVTWGFNNAASLARVSAGGQVLDPGGVALAGTSPGPAAPTSDGGVQLGWVTYASSNNDVFTANVSAANSVGPAEAVSVGTPSQLRPDVATGAGGSMMVYRSSTASANRVMAMPLDPAGDPLLLDPIELDSGGAPTGPGAPAVAWNGSVYMAAWANASGVVARRLLPDGTLLDAAPFVVMASGFGPADLAAMGDTFLVVGLKFGYNPQIINPIAARVRGSDGVVLDATAKVIGGSYSSRPRVAVLGSRWFVIWQQNATHDNPAASTNAVFVNADGTTATASSIYSYSTAGGNAIFDLALASSGSVALAVQSAELSSGVETDLVGRIVLADGTMQPAFNLTPWSGNQYLPRASWDGEQFVVAYVDQKNRFADWTLDPLDARGDLFGMRIGPTGAILDPQGFAFSALATSESFPSVESSSGTSLVSGAILRGAPHDNYRIGYEILGAGGAWPVMVASAAPSNGDVPVTVAFSSAGSFDPDGTIVSYAWDFGDGFTSAEANPTHTYNTPGPFVATVTGTDAAGVATTQTVRLDLLAPNGLPVAAGFAAPASGPAPLDVVFQATGSYDPDGFLGNFYWTFEPGWDYWGATAYHTFDRAGTYLVTLTVYDARGAEGTVTVPVTVTAPNQQPVAVASATPVSGEPPLLVTFSSAGSYDPDGTIASYSWTFGDGGTSTLANPTHTYTTAGAYTATLRVTDNLGATATKSLAITVSSGGCNGTCLRSTDITLTAKVRGTQVNATARVTVKNDLGAAIPGATVSATWTLPGGSQQVRTAVTNAGGVAKLSASGTSGTYTITITNVSKVGYTFDAANSVLTKSITR